MKKHGAEMHFVRPDFVHRTSVLQAIPGYQPVSNAYEIAQRFTAAPYFATALNGSFYGNLPFWEKMRIHWAAMKAKWQAKRVPAMTAAVAATAPPVMPAAPPSAVPAGLPSAGQTQYGVGPANAAMANVGMRITAGLVQTGDDAMPPSVAVPQNDAAQQIAPQTAADVRQLAMMVQEGVPGYVGQSAYQAALDRWNRQRSMWWYNNS
jgi:hypothetical protein